MPNYRYTSSTELNRRGFINKEELLKRVTQEEIFSLVFKYKPEEYSYTTSPIRDDTKPNCFFEYKEGKLWFIDFANSQVWQGIRLSHLDCFAMVQVYFKIPNFYMSLVFIYQQLIEGKENLLPFLETEKKETKTKEKIKILIEARAFNLHDKSFWQDRYRISKDNLIEDKVFPFIKYYLLNTKKGSLIFEAKGIAYSYNNFSNGRKKLYFPLKEGKARFITNCSRNDIGGIDTLVTYGKQLVITKSYKDYRVLKNLGKNVVWFQNEGMIPEDCVLLPLLARFEKIIVWFDNDSPGIIAANKVVKHINTITHLGKASSLHLPEILLQKAIKDPSDCLFLDQSTFYTFTKQYLL
jgi:hypothetical protein